MNKLLCSLFVFLIICSVSAQDFSGSFDMHLTQAYQNGNTRTDTLSYFFGKNRTALIIHGRRNQPDMRLIFNFTDTTITNLFEMNGKKGGYILPMDNEHWPGLAHIEKDALPCDLNQMDQSGESKMIEGYSCYKVLADNSEYHGELWVTPEIPLSMLTILSYQSVGKGKSEKELELYEQMEVNCLPLEMNLESKLGKADVQLTIENISTVVPENIFSTKGHEVSRMD